MINYKEKVKQFTVKELAKRLLTANDCFVEVLKAEGFGDKCQTIETWACAIENELKRRGVPIEVWIELAREK